MRSPAINKKILVIDDDQAIRESVTEILDLDGYKTITAIDGIDAFKLLESLSVDELPGMILLDMMMPNMDGPTFMSEIAKGHMEKLGNIPIVVASANSKIIDSLESKLVVEAIKKPFDLEILLSIVEKHCK